MNLNRVLPNFLALMLAISFFGSLVVAQEAPTSAVGEANYLLKEFEWYTNGLEGKEGTFTKDAKRALTKIAELNKNFPNDERVKDLFERAQAAARLLKGDRIQITELMIAYRDMQSKRMKMLAEANKKGWLDFQSNLLRDGSNPIANAFPSRSPESTPLEKLEGRPVFLEGVRYPDDIFMHYGQPYLAIGDAAKGYYYINTSSQKFVAAYEAIRRYQRNVSDDIPTDWTAIGKITGKRLIVPGGGDRKSGQAFSGWIVDVEAFNVPDKVFARFDEKHEMGAWYVGEESMQEAMSSLYTVNELPDSYTPEQLLNIFVTAIKEKNYPLYLKCIHPEEKRTAVQMNWLERKYDIFQRRFARDIVEVRVGQVDEIRILAGGAMAEDKDILGEFLDDAEVEDITDDGRKRSEMVTLWLKLYDETGRIREYKKALSLKRDEDVEGFNWFVKSGFPF